MQRWLFKSEPSDYSIFDLKRDGRTTWNGIRNAVARNHLRSVSQGDPILFYHTGAEKAVVGVMRAITGPKNDPESDDPKAVALEVEFYQTFATPVTLQQIKKDRAFAGWDLVRISRLSVMPVNEKQWKRIEQLSGS
jgi:predicted RNA-binding protein with PUA-like domain